MWIVLGILFLFILIIVILEVSVSIGMKKSLGKRGDGSISIKYPLPSEQKDLIYKKDYFLNNDGNRFAIFEYKHKNANSNGKVLLMIHGVGCGHFYLFPLINYFAKLGYTVVAYDQFASGLSEGKAISSMSVGERDIKYALDYIDKHYKHCPLYIFGHSWGGFTASIALHYSNRIEKAVIVSGFNRMADIVRGGENGFNRFIGFLLSLVIIRKDAFRYKGVVKLSALDCFKETKAKVLYIQGENDKVVNPEFSGYLFNQLVKNPNVKVKMLENKEHTPFVTKESQDAQNKVASIFGTVGGKLVPIDTYIDYEKISELDLEVCKLMSDFFEN